MLRLLVLDFLKMPWLLQRSQMCCCNAELSGLLVLTLRMTLQAFPCRLIGAVLPRAVTALIRAFVRGCSSYQCNRPLNV